jgi:hypothetical protein
MMIAMGQAFSMTQSAAMVVATSKADLRFS